MQKAQCIAKQLLTAAGQQITWIRGSGADPSSTNCPPRSSVRHKECLISWMPAAKQ